MKLKIGNFARVCQVSVSALRYYDEAGLLSPSHVESWTGYRHYDLDQIRTLNRILALKDLGLSLEQIRQLLREEVPAEQMRVMLRLKQSELEEEAREIRERLARVEARIQHIEMEGKMPEYDVVMKRVDPIRGAILHDTVAKADVKASPSEGAYIHLVDEVADYLRKQGLEKSDVSGPVVDLWYASRSNVSTDKRGLE